MALYVYDLSPVKTGATETKLTRNTCLLYAGICKIYYAKKNTAFQPVELWRFIMFITFKSWFILG